MNPFNGTNPAIFREEYGVQAQCADCARRVIDCPSCHILVGTGQTHSAVDPETGEAGESLCRQCFDARYARCPSCNRTYARDAEGLRMGPDHMLMCESCWDNDCASCIECDAPIYANSDNEVDDGYMCRQCRRRPRELSTTTFDRNKSHRRIGIELEYIQRDHEPNVRRWGNLKGDGSVHARGNQVGEGREFASFISKGDKFLELVDDVTTRMKAVRAQVNETCGFHVHLDMRGSTADEQRNIRLWWIALESIFFGIVHPTRRDNDYCRRVRGMDEYGHHSSRYSALNVTAYSTHESYEVRLHHGTMSKAKIVSWSMLLLGFFDTFGKVDATDLRLSEVERMSDREKVLFLFQQVKLPLQVKRYIVARSRMYKHSPDSLHLGKKSPRPPVFRPTRLQADANLLELREEHISNV